MIQALKQDQWRVSGVEREKEGRSCVVAFRGNLWEMNINMAMNMTTVYYISIHSIVFSIIVDLRC